MPHPCLVANERIPTHEDLVTAVRRFAPGELLPALARVSNAQLSGQDNHLWPRPWTAASLARESVAYGNAWRSARVTAKALARLGWLGLYQADPVVADGASSALDSAVVRYIYQQVPFTRFQPLPELARLIAVCERTDAEYAALGLEVIAEQTWIDLLGMPLRAFARAAFVVFSLARRNDGIVDPAAFADPDLARFGLTSDQVIRVFHEFLAGELAELKPLCARGRHADPAMRRLDFNPLVAMPFVGLGGGRYVAPSIHLVEQRLSLTAIYYLGVTKYRTKFARDLGKLIEDYVGRQLGQLGAGQLIGEQPYGKPGKGGKTCDWLLALAQLTAIFETKAARIPLPGQQDFPAYLAAVNRDVGDSLAKQIPVTLGLIRDGDPMFAGYDLPSEVHAFVVTAEPFLMVTSEFYRTQLPDPGCPYAVLSLGELEWFVAAVLAGADPSELVRTLTGATVIPESVMAEAAARAGSDRPVNPLLERTFDDLVAVPPA